MDTTPRTAATRSRGKQWAVHAGIYVTCATVAVVHVAALTWLHATITVDGVVTWPALIAPALLTVLILPSTWRQSRRWAVCYLIVLFANPLYQEWVLVVTETLTLQYMWCNRRPHDLLWFRTASRGITQNTRHIRHRQVPVQSRNVT